MFWQVFLFDFELFFVFIIFKMKQIKIKNKLISESPLMFVEHSIVSPRDPQSASVNTIDVDIDGRPASSSIVFIDAVAVDEPRASPEAGRCHAYGSCQDANVAIAASSILLF